MELKDYQARSLQRFDNYLDRLRPARDDAVRAAEILRQANIELTPEALNYPAKAWGETLEAGELPRASVRWDSDGTRSHEQYNSWVDGAQRPVPSVCFKVPTGGGKTLMGVFAASAIFSKYLTKNRGLILWIVPNDAIFTQTKRTLTDRDHPYRQALDRAAAGADRVKILEKDDPLNAADVEDHLCVMLLMLQSATRVTKEQLRLFRDRGNVHGFVPPEGDVDAHRALLEEVPNLDFYDDVFMGNRSLKNSLGNVLRIVRPTIVVDEGHRAYSELARRTLVGFNPEFLLELSATPNLAANRLVDVSGADLDEEEMIKLPINVDSDPAADWKTCLNKAFDRLNALQTDAEKLLAETGRYIRPILLVQVERTGHDHRDPAFVHALDVVEYLHTLGMDEGEIAVKTASVNDLKDQVDLLSPVNKIRAIVTKQALQEGWDCPFAYILCSLAPNKSASAMTQLVGRVLRQPHACSTSLPTLNESYVFCHHAPTSEVVAAVKRSLEQDGMGDLVGRVASVGTGPGVERKIPRRLEYSRRQIFLPRVLWVEDGNVRDLDYDQDILAALDWSTADIDGIVEQIAPETHVQTAALIRAGLDLLTNPERTTDTTISQPSFGRFDPVHTSRLLTDVVSNPWIARNMVTRAISALQARGFTAEAIDAASGYITDELRKGLTREQDRLAESCFREAIAAHRIQFRLRADSHNWQVPKDLPTTQPVSAPLLYRPSDAQPAQKSLFAPVYRADFNSLEADFACYLDEDSALDWWFRNVAKKSYALQGWRRHKVFPDFVFAISTQRENKLVVIETKGDHLTGPDTLYKQAFLGTLTEAFERADLTSVGELEMVMEDDTVVVCDLVFGADWQTQLHTRHLGSSSTGGSLGVEHGAPAWPTGPGAGEFGTLT